MKQYTSKNVTETKKIADKHAKFIKSGQIITLTGDLGGGKTTYIQALAKTLGVQKRVTSPTFVLMKIYPVKHKHLDKICHIDAYRIQNPEDLLAIGAGEYLKDKKCLTLIEWGEKVRSILPAHKKITFEVIDNNTRKITFK